ncbi:MULTISPECIES: GAF domain-containing protein [Shewanella]|uniref:GAF domain-containing protein n=1 Tax=Shewanella sedimentimangrovi TaxID=2814293 RepID=A0ABX7QW60_9GAMM|nr:MULTISPECIES: GAF domain-containing protein [Shewanella]QSX35729.1 GAF domain-containing protein [Shewanella sedimentimangrovi]QSX39358.1 GAF domain-containing protein [Shewanella cyperi]
MKSEFYQSLNRQLAALLEGDDDMVSAMANFSAMLNSQLTELNWVGFYIRRGDELVLGPFQGKVACNRIPWGKGVCGTAAALDSTQRVADVHQFDGHIACDSASNSEIVIPVRKQGQVVAVLDIDSPVFDRFDEADQLGLEQAVRVLENTLFG